MIFFYIFPEGYMGRTNVLLTMEVNGKALVLFEGKTSAQCKKQLSQLIAPPLEWTDLEMGNYVVQEAKIQLKEKRGATNTDTTTGV